MSDIQRADRLVTVVGGSGFVGRHVVRALAREGWRIKVACRRPDLAIHLQPLGRVGQIAAVQANLRYPASIAAACAGSTAVVNLVGILAEGGAQTFEAVQAQGARTVAEAAKAAGVETFVQMSAIGADPDGAAEYARTKAAGEAGARAVFPDAVVVRPSIVFGPEDDFFNRFAAMARVSPVLPLIGGGHTRFQPVFVGDVAAVIARACARDLTMGATYELGGPEVKTFRALLEFVCATIDRRRALLPIPFAAARLPAAVTETLDAALMGLFPKMLVMTRDQLALLETDNVVSPAAIAERRTLEGLGLSATSIATEVPAYLYRFRKTGQFARDRSI